MKVFNIFQKPKILTDQSFIKKDDWISFQKKLELLGDLIEKGAPRNLILNLWKLSFLNAEILRRKHEAD